MYIYTHTRKMQTGFLHVTMSVKKVNTLYLQTLEKKVRFSEYNSLRSRYL